MNGVITFLLLKMRAHLIHSYHLMSYYRLPNTVLSAIKALTSFHTDNGEKLALSSRPYY